MVNGVAIASTKLSEPVKKGTCTIWKAKKATLNILYGMCVA